MRIRRRFRSIVLLLLLTCLAILLILMSGQGHTDSCTGPLCDIRTAVGRFLKIFKRRPHYTGPIVNFEKYPCFKRLPRTSGVSGIDGESCVRTLAKDAVNKETECSPLKTFAGSVPLCFQNSTLVKRFITHGFDDIDLVKQVHDALVINPDLQFLDIGTGLGIYTLTAATLDRKVFAVDPVLENLLSLSVSLIVSNQQSKVTLIWNAVSNTNGVAFLQDVHGFPPRYQLKLYDIETDREPNSKSLVESVTLDSMAAMFKRLSLFVKIDMSSNTANVTDGMGKFLESVDVRYILMNFGGFKLTEASLDVVDTLIDNTYDPYIDIRRTRALNKQDLTKWPDQVFWIKSY